MPKIVDHARRRDEIASVACRVIARHGFEQTTIARIAAEAGYTTGMVAHYFDSKHDIVLAALRLVLRRIDERLTRSTGTRPCLLELLAETLPIDEPRSIECAFWVAFWGQVAADQPLARINDWVHEEYARLYERCFAVSWPEWRDWDPALRAAVLSASATFINGLTATAVINPAEWPGERLLLQLGRQLDLWHAWAGTEHGRSGASASTAHDDAASFTSPAARRASGS
jgi:TetR/AcrR family transcriptional regulator, transcriptional repressor of bet genes